MCARVLSTQLCKVLNNPVICQSFNIKNATTMSDITSRITTIIVDKLGVDASAVRPEADFSNDLGADSLDKVEVIMDVETEFGISIPDEEAEKLQTVGEAIAYLEKHLQ